MKYYFIKMALRRISPMIWRRLQIPGNVSLAKLHHIIQIVYGWDNEHLHQFHIHGKDYGISYLGGIAFSDNADKIFLDDFELVKYYITCEIGGKMYARQTSFS